MTTKTNSQFQFFFFAQSFCAVRFILSAYPSYFFFCLVRVRWCVRVSFCFFFVIFVESLAACGLVYLGPPCLE